MELYGLDTMSIEDFRSDLIRAGFLAESGVAGIYHRSFRYESIVRALESYISGASNCDEARRLYFAPVMPQSTLVTSGYVRSFPDLIGVISSFAGGNRELPELLDRVAADKDWTELLTATDVVLCSAACHNIYPTFAHQKVPSSGIIYEVQGTCFRHEPSEDPARMQSFRMHEFVYLGTAEGALAHRQEWIGRGSALLQALGLTLDLVVANDPFFGRVGRVLAHGQLEKELKYEVTAQISSDNPGAIASGNYHEDHLAIDFDISLEEGGPMHSACFAFGLDRITLALIHVHGTDLTAWPTSVRDLLSPPNPFVKSQ